MAARKAKKTTTQGTVWSESDYAQAGYSRTNLRLPPELAEPVQRLADELGIERGEAIRLIIRDALSDVTTLGRRLKKLKPAKP